MRFFVPSFFLGLLAIGCGSANEAAFSTGGSGGAAATTTGTTTTTGFGGFGGAATTTTTTGTSTSGGGMDGGVTTSTNTSSTTSSTTTTTGTQHGDCAADGDCGGGACVEITPGGFLVCATPPEAATFCGSSLDQCCENMPCPNGEPCFASPLVPICAGAQMEPHNQCAVDQCTKDEECAPSQICGIAGALGHQIRACVPAGCKVDADCAAAPGGICAPIADPCCSTFAGLACVYPNGGCRSNADCDPTESCQIMGSAATCQPGNALCPP